MVTSLENLERIVNLSGGINRELSQSATATPFTELFNGK
jgi:hypothetical protein